MLSAACIVKDCLHCRYYTKCFPCITLFNLTTNLLGPFHRLENGAKVLSKSSNFIFLISGRARLELQAAQWVVSALNEQAMVPPLKL